jgi:prepilin peptidase CpaA
MHEPMLLTMVGAALIAGAAYDVATLTIPNWISLALLALFPLVALNAGFGWSETGVHLAVGFAALVAGAALFATGGIGGGDAKLFAAVSLYVGAGWFPAFVVYVALAGGAVAVAVLAVRWSAAFGIGARLGWLQHLLTGKGIPYGVAIAAGGLAVLPGTHLFLGSCRGCEVTLPSKTSKR